MCMLFLLLSIGLGLFVVILNMKGKNMHVLTLFSEGLMI